MCETSELYYLKVEITRFTHLFTCQDITKVTKKQISTYRVTDRHLSI